MEHALPERNADTMSDAIAISSPNGRMSKRAHDAAMKRLAEKLFGPEGGTRDQIVGRAPERTQIETLVFSARQDRQFAKMAGSAQAKKLIKRAEAAEAQIIALWQL